METAAIAATTAVQSCFSIFGPFGRQFGLKRPQKLPLPSGRRTTFAARKLGPSRGLLITILATKTRPTPYTWALFHSQFLCCSSSRLLVLSFSLSALTCPRRHDHRVLPPPASTVAVDGGDGRRGGRSVVL